MDAGAPAGVRLLRRGIADVQPKNQDIQGWDSGALLQQYETVHVEFVAYGAERCARRRSKASANQ